MKKKYKWTVLFILVATFMHAQAQRVVTHGGVPVVSPDASHIAFLSNRSGADELFVISPDGTGEVQLTDTPEDKGALAWTPDGSASHFRATAPARRESG
jgi:Tol biopolymer transport system component